MSTWGWFKWKRDYALDLKDTEEIHIQYLQFDISMYSFQTAQ